MAKRAISTASKPNSASNLPVPNPTKRSRPLPLYEASSQFRHWRYSTSQLDRLRQDLNQQAIQIVASKLALENKAAKTTTTTETEISTPPSSDPGQFLTANEELCLITFYLSQIPSLCRAFKVPEVVQATSQTYLKRFYLSNTTMDYHPKHVMLTCVFLACKTENHMIPIESFAAKLKESTQSILGLEFLVSQSLRFEYKVHHALSAVQGLLLDLQTTPVPLESIQALSEPALNHARTARSTDLEFLYTPSQIALACVRLVDNLAVEIWLDEKLGLKSKSEARKSEGRTAEEEEEGTDDLDKRLLLKELDKIMATIKEVESNGATTTMRVDRDKVKEIDRRLKLVSNPEKDPNSILYKKKQEELAKERDDKARAKAALKPKNDDASVFD